MVCFFYTSWISVLIFKMVTDPTGNLKVIHIMSHVVTILAGLTFGIILGETVGFGLAVRYIYEELRV